MRILRAGLQPALRHYNRWMRLGCERLLHGAVGAHLDGETVPRNARALVDAQIKTGKADGRFGHAPGDAPLAFGFVRDHVTGSDQIEALWIPEREVVARKLHVGVGIPGAAGTDKVNLVACILDHSAFVVELDFVIAPGFERALRDYQEEIVAV